MIAFEYIDLQIIFKEIARELIHSIKTLDAHYTIYSTVYVVLYNKCEVNYMHSLTIHYCTISYF